MKKYTSIRPLIALCMSIFIVVFPKTSSAERFVHVGVSRSSITAESQWTTGYLLGLQWQKGFAGRLSYSYGLQAAWRPIRIEEKAAVSYPGFVNLNNYDIRPFYLDVPLALHFSVNPRKLKTLDVFVGTSVNFCLTARAEFERIRTLYEPPLDPGTPIEYPPYDYTHIEDPGPIIPLLENTYLGLVAGFQWRLFRHPISLTYMYSKLGSISAIEFLEPYHNLCLSVAFDTTRGF